MDRNPPPIIRNIEKEAMNIEVCKKCKHRRLSRYNEIWCWLASSHLEVSVICNDDYDYRRRDFHLPTDCPFLLEHAVSGNIEW